MFEDATVEELVDGPSCDLLYAGAHTCVEAFFVRVQELLEVILEELAEGRTLLDIKSRHA